MGKEIIYINCANQACTQTIPFVRGNFAVPERTYCDYCCNDSIAPPNEQPIDTRVMTPLLGPRKES